MLEHSDLEDPSGADLTLAKAAPTDDPEMPDPAGIISLIAGTAAEAGVKSQYSLREPFYPKGNRFMQ